MYAFIEGKLEHKREGLIILSNNGIGYNILVGSNTLSKVGIVGEGCKLFTYLQVKEDALTLFGFTTLEEKKMFEKLITISGVGCKMAVQIVGGLELSVLAVSIASGDISALNKIKGVGKKTAERIVLELREQVGKEEMPLFADFSATKTDGAADDAVLALVSLGFAKAEAFAAVTKASEKGKTTEEIITIALRSINK